MDSQSIIAALPYGPGFRFVDTIEYIDEHRVKGSCYLEPDWPFFKDHFVNYPVVPGVILTEVMAQIGLACLAVYLNREEVEAGVPADPGIRASAGRLGAGAGPDTGSGVESGTGIVDGPGAGCGKESGSGAVGRSGRDVGSGVESGSGAVGRSGQDVGADSPSGSIGRKLWAFSAAELQFLKPVFPGERVCAESERIYYRFGKLKCRVRLYNEAQELVSEGVLEGLLVDRKDGARPATLP